MRLRDGPETAELGVGEVELDPLVARPLLVAVRRRRRGRLRLLDCSLSPVGRNSTLLLFASNEHFVTSPFKREAQVMMTQRSNIEFGPWQQARRKLPD